jgi:hypothetical protein
MPWPCLIPPPAQHGLHHHPSMAYVGLRRLVGSSVLSSPPPRETSPLSSDRTSHRAVLHGSRKWCVECSSAQYRTTLHHTAPHCTIRYLAALHSISTRRTKNMGFLLASSGSAVSSPAAAVVFQQHAQRETSCARATLLICRMLAHLAPVGYHCQPTSDTLLLLNHCSSSKTDDFKRQILTRLLTRVQFDTVPTLSALLSVTALDTRWLL